MSSDTPSFKLWPVNSTFVYWQAVSITYALKLHSLDYAHLLHINTRGAFEDLRYGLIDRIVVSWCLMKYLDDSSVSCTLNG